MRIQIFGGWDPTYARNRVLRLGLQRLGIQIDSCRVPPYRYVAVRYAALWARSMRLPKPDLILVPEFRHRDVPMARWMATMLGIPLVVDPLVSRYDTKVRDWQSTRPGSYEAGHARRVDRAAMRFADLLLCDTPQHADLFQREYRVPPERCWVVPVGFDDGVFQPVVEKPGPFRVGFFGSYLPLHGIETILRAAQCLAQDNIRFTLIGSGQTHRLVNEAQDIKNNLDVLPTMPPLALRERLSRCHILLGIFGTTSKAQHVVPNKLYQSLAMQRAVVTADTPAIRSFFRHGEHLWTTPPGDGEALAAAIRMLQRNVALRQRLAREGCLYVYRAFDPVAVAKRFLEGCREICEIPTPEVV